MIFQRSSASCRPLIFIHMKKIIALLIAISPLFAHGQQCVMSRLGDWMIDSIALHGSMQGMALNNHYAITLRHGGQCVILNLLKRRIEGSFQLQGNNTHCNNISTFYPKGGKKDPIYYISSCFGDKACYVTQITKDSAVSLQKIFFDSEAFPVAQDWCVDADNGLIYAFGGRRGGMMYLKELKLPDLSQKEVHFSENDVIKTIPINCVKVAQGSKIKDGYAYLPDGDEPGQYYLHVINLSSGKEVKTIDLNHIGLEPEGIDVVGRWIYLSFNTSNPYENKIYRFRR